MRKFLKTSHVIARIFLYICVIGVLLLYFFKPGVIGQAPLSVSGTNFCARPMTPQAANVILVDFGVPKRRRGPKCAWEVGDRPREVGDRPRKKDTRGKGTKYPGVNGV